jgi:hypothetical protein
MNAPEEIECDCLEDGCPACRERLEEIKRDARYARRLKRSTPKSAAEELAELDSNSKPYQRIRETPAPVAFDTAGILQHVSDSTLNQFMRAVAGNVTVDDTRPMPTILESKGRCIRVHHTDARGFGVLNWHDMSETLLGTCNPVEEFRADGNFVVARLKTDAQLEADGAAFDLDQLHGELKTYWPYWDEEAAAPAVMRTKSEIKASKKKKTRTVPEGKVAPAVLRVMERDCPIGAMDREELISLTKDALDPDVDKFGKDRRRAYIKQAIDALVKREFLRVCGEDDEQLELTNET